MQALRADTYVHVSLSKTYKGQPRRVPVWEMRYRLRSGKDSTRVLGKAWTKRGRPPRGFLSEQEALAKANAFASQHAGDTPDVRRCFGAALEVFIRRCEKEKQLRGSTLHEYGRIGERLARRPWRGELSWKERPLEDFGELDLLDLRGELLDAERSAHTLNHYRRVLRGVFGTQASSPALAWDWVQPKLESEGRLHFYTPAQVRRLCEHAHSDLDRAIFTLMTQAGPRLSEVRALKVENLDFAMGLLRFQDGYTTHGGHAGNKGRRVRSVPMSCQVRAALAPLCEGRDAQALVFEEADRPGKALCGVNLYRRFVSAAKRAGLPRICLHDLRHTFGTRAIRKFPLHEVQRMMGHRHISTTEIYVHYAPDPDGAEKLTALWEEDDAPRAAPDRHDAAAAEEMASVIPLHRAA